MTTRRRVLGGGMVAAGIAAVGLLPIPIPGIDSPPHEEPCWQGQMGRTMAICGTYVVPENYAHPEGRKVESSYIRLRRPGVDLAKPPVLFIDGGPGAGTVGPDDFNPSFWSSWMEGIGFDREVILFDQRGMGSSKPSLNCTELDDPVVRVGLSHNTAAFPPWGSLSDAALKECRTRLVSQGIDLDQYNASNIIRDIEFLRKRLGFQKIVPYGVSNGTRLALKYLRDHGGMVEAMILDSVTPPDVTISQEYVFSFAEAIRSISETCRQQSLCGRAHVDISRSLKSALDRLAQTPIVVEIDNRKGDEKLYLRVNDTVFLEILLDIAYGSGAYRNIVQFIDDTARGRDHNLQPYANRMIYEGNYSEFLYEGAYWSIDCSDEYDPTTTAAYVSRLERYPILKRWAREYWANLPCRFWSMTLASDRERMPVESDVPTLVVTGRLDPITPPSNAWRVSRTLANSQVIVFPIGGHTVSFLDACGMQVVGEFLDRKYAKVAASCVDDLKPPVFEVSPAALVGNSE